jgi:chitinase
VNHIVATDSQLWRARQLRAVCLAILAFATLPVCGTAISAEASFRIAGYLPEYRAARFDPEDARGLTDLILFSAEPTVTGQLDSSHLDAFPWTVLRELRARQGVRLLLCVGGWGRSTHFPEVAGSEQLRQEFVRSAVRLCLERELDGLDLDWEHPANQAEQESYADLMMDLRRGFEPHGLILSLTMAGWQQVPQRAFAAVDRVQLMSYDHPGAHSTFEAAEAEVRKLIAAGVPPNKLILGLPFYGRDITNRRRTMSYRDILNRYRPDPDVNEVDNLFFNGPGLIRRKTELALEAGLAGVMFWELGQDAAEDGSLLKVIRSTIASWSRSARTPRRQQPAVRPNRMTNEIDQTQLAAQRLGFRPGVTLPSISSHQHVDGEPGGERGRRAAVVEEEILEDQEPTRGKDRDGLAQQPPGP